MTVQEAYNKILPLLEYYIVTDLFTEYGMKELMNFHKQKEVN